MPDNKVATKEGAGENDDAEAGTGDFQGRLLEQGGEEKGDGAEEQPVKRHHAGVDGRALDEEGGEADAEGAGENEQDAPPVHAGGGGVALGLGHD
ncbi:MAG: hypothetical protein LUG50_07070 [Planctomycetaceae bacterium]|nr:hypothetical protein [Planctomycetaceae bacterium]